MAHRANSDGGGAPIVVGVDGSERSKAALSWAAEYAGRVGAPLQVVIAWQWPASYGWTLPIPDGWDPETDARTLLEDEVATIIDPASGLDVTLSVVEGPAAHVLTEASLGAALLVVASTGHGEAAGVLLGSVSEYLTTHAHCPVVVVRDGHGERAPHPSLQASDVAAGRPATA